MKTYLLFDIIHLIKNIRNNLLNRKKFVFPEFIFDLFRDNINVPAGFISWDIFYKLYEKDEHLDSNLRKAHKLTYRTIHPGNKKQNVSLAPAIFDKTTSAGIISYFPERDDAASFLSLFHKLFIICNSKQQFNLADQLGNAVVKGDNKPEFMSSLADWVESWANIPSFTFTKQTSHALITTLRATAALINEILKEGYKFVLTSRFQSDPIELHFSKYRQMSGGRFLVSLREVKTSEKIISLTSLIKENIDFWEHELKSDDQTDMAFKEIKEKLLNSTTEILESELSDDSKEVAVHIAGFIARKLSKRRKCEDCSALLKAGENTIKHDEYLKLLSRGGLVCPSPALHNFVCQTFSIIDWLSPYLQSFAETVSVRKVAEKLLHTFLERDVSFTCSNHFAWGKTFCVRTIINIYYNNKQRITCDLARNDQIQGFKKRQRKSS